LEHRNGILDSESLISHLRGREGADGVGDRPEKVISNTKSRKDKLSVIGKYSILTR